MADEPKRLSRREVGIDWGDSLRLVVVVTGVTAIGYVYGGPVLEQFVTVPSPADWILEAALVSLVAGLLASRIVLRPLQRQLHQEERNRQRHEERLFAELELRDFEASLTRALDMAVEEPDILRVAGRAIDRVIPDVPAEVLLADSSRAHLHREATVGDEAPGCPVPDPRSCPAVRASRRLSFPDADALDACPYLVDRGVPATCVPLAITGQSIGVVHVAGESPLVTDPDVHRRLDAMSSRIGDRLGMVRALERSRRQAATDHLTGLLNRRSLREAVGGLRERDEQYGLAMLDLDHFKRLNDTHGHDVGDAALKVFSKVLQGTTRDDDIVARTGGEEFVIVVPGGLADQVYAVVERIRSELPAACLAAGCPTFTVSAGVCDSRCATDFDAALSTADAALLSAKRAGRDRTVRADGLSGDVRSDLPSPDDTTPEADGDHAGPPAAPPDSDGRTAITS